MNFAVDIVVKTSVILISAVLLAALLSRASAATRHAIWVLAIASALLRILEQKGHIRHEENAGKYVFMPTVHREKAKRSAIRHLVQTFFDGSPEDAVAALLDASSSKLSDAELDRLQQLIEKARKGGRK